MRRIGHSGRTMGHRENRVKHTQVSGSAETSSGRSFGTRECCGCSSWNSGHTNGRAIRRYVDMCPDKPVERVRSRWWKKNGCAKALQARRVTRSAHPLAESRKARHNPPAMPGVPILVVPGALSTFGYFSTNQPFCRDSRYC